MRLENQTAMVKGPKGELSHVVHDDIAVKKEDSALIVSVKETLAAKPAKQARALWGLTRSLLFNMIEGVSKGYEKRLEVEGTGYRASVQGDSLELSLGFSHPVRLKLPPGIAVSLDKNTIVVSGIDKGQVGEFAATIRRQRPVEPYKGKGIKYQGEYVRRKEGKKAAGATGAAGAA